MTTYYVDTGGDNSDGTSLAKAWTTAASVNAHTFSAGDVLIFTAGQTFAGPFTFDDNGTSGSYIRIGTGRNASATVPDFSAGGQWLVQSNPVTITAGDGNGINLNDCEYVWLDNITVTGSGVNTTTGASTSTGMGISVKSTQTTNKLRGVRVTAATVTDCKDGIFCHTLLDTKVGYDGLQIWGCRAYENQRVGIIVLNHDGTFASGSRTQNANIYIGYSQSHGQTGNVTAQCQGSGFDIRNTTTATIEHCVAHTLNIAGYNDAVGGSAGFGCAMVDGVTMQHCEAYNVLAPNNIDGVGFDVDKGAINCTVQYCYAHDNDGAGIFLAQVSGAALTGVTVRYNICADNIRVAATNHGELTTICQSQAITGAAYGNTLYASNGDAVRVTEGTDHELKLINNILVSKAGAYCINAGTDTVGAMVGNIYYAIGGGTTTVRVFSTNYTTIADLRTAGWEKLSAVNYGDFVTHGLDSPGSAPSTGTLPANPVASLRPYFDLAASNASVAVEYDDAAIAISPGARDFHGYPNRWNGTYCCGAVQYQPWNRDTSNRPQPLVGTVGC